MCCVVGTQLLPGALPSGFGVCWKETPGSTLKLRDWHARKGGDAQGSPVPSCCVPEELSLALGLFCVCVCYNGFGEHASLRGFFLLIRQ